ncbi:MAG: dihydroorotate dehydrogenase electron transfer subunit [Clostridia bacterium]|nr:dihydroorotate dehydrogenase electron transfer subunit [Clostridia bacterium]
MRYCQETGTLARVDQLTDTVYSFTIEAPQIASLAQCGQFVHVLCEPFMLRRPLSIAGFDKEAGTVRIVFEVRGKGTAWMAALKEGDAITLNGPLGHGFPLLDPDKKAVLVGGGIGTPPMMPIARHYGQNATAISGFKTASAVILQEDFEAFGVRTVLCTDDGTAGQKGFTTDALETVLTEGAADVVYTCGPKVMMKRVAAVAKAHGVPCYISMEERMGCGVGACFGCACKTKTKDGGTTMTRVCLNGPVFDANEIDWEG